MNLEMNNNLRNQCANANKCNNKKCSHFCFEPKKESRESIALSMVKKMIKSYEESQKNI